MSDEDTADEREQRLRAADRNWDELIGELRVVLTGVAVLFSVLLTVPFSANFGGDGDFQQGVYLAALLLVAASLIALIAPVAYHRIGYEREHKPAVVSRSNVLVITGLVLLALGIASVLLLVLDALLGRQTALVIAGVTGVVAGVTWFVPAFRGR